jgi:hypothetical protein
MDLLGADHRRSLMRMIRVCILRMSPPGGRAAGDEKEFPVKRYLSLSGMLAATLFGALALSPAQPASAVLAGGSISGFVYQDTNNNGVQDAGEPGIAGVTITLSGDDAAVTTTDAAGAYTFVLSPDCCTYTVTETQPAGFADGIDTVGDSFGTLGNDVFTNIDIDGDDATGYNFGELPLTTPTAQRKLKTHTPTATPTAAATNTATRTPTPVPATSTPQPSPVGGAGARIQAPDTGTGGSGGRDTRTAGIVFAALALLAAGSAVAGWGVWQRTWCQR